MLLVGIDWAEAYHAVCWLTPDGGLVRRLTIAQAPGGLRRLRSAVADAEPDPTAVLVALERPDGLLVDALLVAGYRVYALNPQAVERYRGRTRTTGAKSDPADAELLARILCTDRDRHRPLQSSSPQVETLRPLARQDERASRDQRRLLNRLRHDLLDAFPQALAAFPDLGAVAALTFLARWPSAADATDRGVAEIAALLRQGRHGWPRRAAERIHATLRVEALAAPAHRAQARAGDIRLLAQQLLLLHRQRVAWERELAALLVGDGAHPDGERLLSLPGLATRLAARVLGEIGDRRERFPTPPRCNATPAPRRSPKPPGGRAWSALAGPATASCARRCCGGRSARWAAPPGRAPATTSSGHGARPTRPRCGRWPTAGWRSCTTCWPPARRTTKPSTCAIGPSRPARWPHDRVRASRA